MQLSVFSVFLSDLAGTSSTGLFMRSKYKTEEKRKYKKPQQQQNNMYFEIWLGFLAAFDHPPSKMKLKYFIKGPET